MAKSEKAKIAPEVEAFLKSQITGMSAEAEKDIIPMTVRLPKTVVAMMKIKATLLDTTVQDAVQDLFKKWLTEG